MVRGAPIASARGRLWLGCEPRRRTSPRWLRKPRRATQRTRTLQAVLGWRDRRLRRRQSCQVALLAGGTCCILFGNPILVECRWRRRPRPQEGHVRPWSMITGRLRHSLRRQSLPRSVGAHVGGRSTMSTSHRRKSVRSCDRRHVCAFVRTALPVDALLKVPRRRRGCRAAATVRERCSWSRSAVEVGARVRSVHRGVAR